MKKKENPNKKKYLQLITILCIFKNSYNCLEYNTNEYSKSNCFYCSS